MGGVDVDVGASTKKVKKKTKRKRPTTTSVEHASNLRRSAYDNNVTLGYKARKRR